MAYPRLTYASCGMEATYREATFAFFQLVVLTFAPCVSFAVLSCVLIFQSWRLEGSAFQRSAELDSVCSSEPFFAYIPPLFGRVSSACLDFPFPLPGFNASRSVYCMWRCLAGCHPRVLIFPSLCLVSTPVGVSIACGAVGRSSIQHHIS